MIWLSNLEIERKRKRLNYNFSQELLALSKEFKAYIICYTVQHHILNINNHLNNLIKIYSCIPIKILRFYYHQNFQNCVQCEHNYKTVMSSTTTL